MIILKSDLAIDILTSPADLECRSIGSRLVSGFYLFPARRLIQKHF